MTDDEQEALSYQHSHGLWIVPLSSGRIAVFDHPAGSLQFVAGSWWQVADLEPAFRAHRLQKAAARVQQTHLQQLPINLKDLDL